MFAPVANMNTMRVLLSLVANLNWPLHPLIIKNAFLNMVEPPQTLKLPHIMIILPL